MRRKGRGGRGGEEGEGRKGRGGRGEPMLRCQRVLMEGVQSKMYGVRRVTGAGEIVPTDFLGS